MAPTPKELIALGIGEYRQTAFKPYRVTYRVSGQKVYIYLIADGRQGYAIPAVAPVARGLMPGAAP